MIWRISGRQHFQTLARTGRRAGTQSLWCRFVNDPTACPLRVAFSVGRSVGPATRRNRLRRRLRAIVPAAAAAAGINNGWLLIGAKPDAGELTFGLLRIEVEMLVRQLITPTGGRT